MPSLAQLLGEGLWSHATNADKATVLLDGANEVDTNPTAAEVEQFFDKLTTYWNPGVRTHVPALLKVLGTPVGTGYHGGFLRGAGSLPWAHFHREIIALQLIVRIADYKYIEQETHPLCGPLTLIQGVARHDREQYVDYVIGLATNRQGKIGELTASVRAGSALLHKHPHPDSMKEADYIALASLRNSANLLPYRSRLTNRRIEGGTTAGEIVTWMKEAGFTNVEDHTHPFWRAAGMLRKGDRRAFAQHRMQRNIQKMQARLAGGDTVIMAAAGNLAHMTQGNPDRDPKYVTMSGGHVMLVEGVTITGTGVQFRVVTFGKQVTNPVEIPWSKIGSWYYGFVCGQP